MSGERITSSDKLSGKDHFSRVNERFAGMSPGERIDLLYRKLNPGKIILSTSGGPTSAILPTLVRDTLNARGDNRIIPIVFVDTLLYDHYSPSTLRFIEELRERGKNKGWNIYTYKPAITRKDLDRLYPAWEKSDSSDFNKAKVALKKEPLERALSEMNGYYWLSGPMRWETPSRADMPFVTKRKNGIAIHPIVDMTEQQAKDYIAKHGLPTNPNHYDYLKGADQKSECSIHT